MTADVTFGFFVVFVRFTRGSGGLPGAESRSIDVVSSTAAATFSIQLESPPHGSGLDRSGDGPARSTRCSFQKQLSSWMGALLLSALLPASTLRNRSPLGHRVCRNRRFDIATRGVRVVAVVEWLDQGTERGVVLSRVLFPRSSFPRRR